MAKLEIMAILGELNPKADEVIRMAGMVAATLRELRLTHDDVAAIFSEVPDFNERVIDEFEKTGPDSMTASDLDWVFDGFFMGLVVGRLVDKVEVPIPEASVGVGE